ncbi:MAG: hypothetical protein R2695_06495 [Acidimicrobiales bacterium]
MAFDNTITVVGNVTGIPELRFTQGAWPWRTSASPGTRRRPTAKRRSRSST